MTDNNLGAEVLGKRIQTAPAAITDLHTRAAAHSDFPIISRLLETLAMEWIGLEMPMVLARQATEGEGLFIVSSTQATSFG